MLAAKNAIHTTTVRFPRPLYDQAQDVVAERIAGIDTFNDLIVSALKGYLRVVERREIDRAFAAMAEDADYQKEATLIQQEFERSDWEALELSEGTH